MVIVSVDVVIGWESYWIFSRASSVFTGMCIDESGNFTLLLFSSPTLRRFMYFVTESEERGIFLFVNVSPKNILHEGL